MGLLRFSLPISDQKDNPLNLHEHLVKHPSATFFVICNTDSMINAFIPPKAMLVVDRSITPCNGDMVYAEIEGEFKIRYLKKNTHKAWLIPANPKYKTIEITAGCKCTLWGIVTNVITDLKDVRHVGFG